MPKHLAILAVSVCILCGCAVAPAAKYHPDDNSGVKPGTVVVGLLPGVLRAASSPDSGALIAVFRSDPAREALLISECGFPRSPPPGPRPEAAPPLVPIIAALGQLLFNLYIDSQMRALETLKRAAKPDPYTARLFLNADDFRNAKCLAIVRFDEPKKPGDNPSPGLIAVLKMTLVPEYRAGTDGFVFKPIYIRAWDTLAATAKPESASDWARIDVAAAISVKQVAKTSVGDLTVMAQSEGLARVGGVAVGPSAPASCEKGCPSSDLFAYPTRNATISLSVSVAEIGKVGFDIDAATAELKAIRDAIGPAINKGLEIYYK